MLEVEDNFLRQDICHLIIGYLFLSPGLVFYGQYGFPPHPLHTYKY